MAHSEGLSQEPRGHLAKCVSSPQAGAHGGPSPRPRGFHSHLLPPPPSAQTTSAHHSPGRGRLGGHWAPRPGTPPSGGVFWAAVGPAPSSPVCAQGLPRTVRLQERTDCSPWPRVGPLGLGLCKQVLRSKFPKCSPPPPALEQQAQPEPSATQCRALQDPSHRARD